MHMHTREHMQTSSKQLNLPDEILRGKQVCKPRTDPSLELSR